MSTQTLCRVTPADLEIRGDGRTIAGIAVPFDEPAEVAGRNGHSYTEILKRGAFAKTISERAQRIKFLANHDAITVSPSEPPTCSGKTQPASAANSKSLRPGKATKP
jgi:hypothetical protein